MMLRDKNTFTIDSTKGGNGDIWMRLVSLYTVAALLPKLKIRIIVPDIFRNLAQSVFGSRIYIVKHQDRQNTDLYYTSLGMKDLVIEILNGKRFISPYQRSVYFDKKKRQLKDHINVVLFGICDILGLVQVPAWKWIPYYQGYLDIVSVKKFRHIGYGQFVAQLKKDYDSQYQRLRGPIPISSELKVPQDLEKKTIVFPTGTSRQFMPLFWAIKNLPDAYFAFFYKDKEAEIFQNHGLRTIYFYQEPGDIIYLAQRAKWTVSTDSFPSHLLQYCLKRCTITITEVLKSRIISPVFEGKVIDSEVHCHPCLHLDRKNHPNCMAGFSSCKNWENNLYTKNLIDSIN